MCVWWPRMINVCCLLLTATLCTPGQINPTEQTSAETQTSWLIIFRCLVAVVTCWDSQEKRPCPASLTSSTESFPRLLLHYRLSRPGEKLHCCLSFSQLENECKQPEGQKPSWKHVMKVCLTTKRRNMRRSLWSQRMTVPLFCAKVGFPC